MPAGGRRGTCDCGLVCQPHLVLVRDTGVGLGALVQAEEPELPLEVIAFDLVAVADVEDGIHSSPRRQIRDLASDDAQLVRDVVAHPEACRRRFTRHAPMPSRIAACAAGTRLPDARCCNAISATGRRP